MCIMCEKFYKNYFVFDSLKIVLCFVFYFLESILYFVFLFFEKYVSSDG
jgi:hypothetical protein